MSLFDMCATHAAAVPSLSIYYPLTSPLMQVIQPYSRLKFVALFFLPVILSLHINAQSFTTPISGSIYGQAIVACSGANNGYEYTATDAAIYSRKMNINEYYAKVYTAPGALQIVSFSDKQENGNRYRAILLQDRGNHFFVVYNKVKTPLADSTIYGPVALAPAYSGKYKKILAGRDLYLYSFLAGGPSGNVDVSRDNGQSWKPDTVNIGYDNVLDIALAPQDTVYLAANDGIYKQLPGDSVWIKTNNNINGAGKIFVDRQNKILIGSYPPSVAISTDGGVNFNSLNNGIAGQVKYFADDAYGNLYASTGTSPLYRNAGGSGSWTDLQAGINAIGTNPGITCISGDSLLTIGTSGYGLITSNNQGASWLTTNNGIHAEDVYSLVKQANGRLLCTTSMGIFYKDAADTLWHTTNPITNFYPGRLLFNDPSGTVYVAQGATFGGPYPLGKSIDGGANFTIDSNGFSSIGGSGFYIDETGDRHFYNVYGTQNNTLTIWTSTFGSSTWHLDTIGLPKFTLPGQGVLAMCSDKKGFLYAVVNFSIGVFMYRRPISGNTWVVDNNGLFNGLAITPMASNASIGIVAAQATTLYHRTANSWETLAQLNALGDSGTVANSVIDALSVNDEGVIFAAVTNYNRPDSSAIFYSVDTGHSWQLAGLIGYRIISLPSYGTETYALTLGKWGYVQNGTTPTTLSEIAGRSKNIKVFPNPSSSGCWEIEATAEMLNSKLDVLDVNGRIVYQSTLQESKSSINIPGLTSGVYILHLQGKTANASSWLVKQ